MTKIEAINIARTEALSSGWHWSDTVAARHVWWPLSFRLRWRVVAGDPYTPGTVTIVVDDATGEILESSVLFHSQHPLTFAQRVTFCSLFAALYLLLPGTAIWFFARLILSVSPLFATLIAFFGAPIFFCTFYAGIIIFAHVTHKKRRVRKETAA